MCYVAPLRAAVLSLGFDGHSFSTEAVRASARVTMARAEAYATRLVHDKVLRVNRCGKLVRSTGWQEWATREARTRPGGDSRSYLAQRAKRDDRPIVSEVIALCVRALRGERKCGEVARAARISKRQLHRIETGQQRPSPRTERRLFRVLNGH